MVSLDALKSRPKVLLLEDEPTQRHLLTRQIERQGYHVIAAENGRIGIALWQENPEVRIVVTDLLMPDIDGFAVVEHIRQNEAHYTYILVLTAMDDHNALLQALSLGADDYVCKPILKEELALRLQGGARLLRLEGLDDLVFALAEMSAYRSGETGSHLKRVREYCFLLADDLRIHHPELGLTKSLVSDIASVSVLHDIGKVGIPDYVLHKPGRLTKEEFKLMQTHTTISGKILMDLYRKNGSNYLLLGCEIAIAHHEKWDGSGYPYGLIADEIPVSARVMALADVFDALTSRRCYKDAFSCKKAKDIITQEMANQFDPMLLASFLRIADKMEDVLKDNHFTSL